MCLPKRNMRIKWDISGQRDLETQPRRFMLLPFTTVLSSMGLFFSLTFRFYHLSSRAGIQNSSFLFSSNDSPWYCKSGSSWKLAVKWLAELNKGQRGKKGTWPLLGKRNCFYETCQFFSGMQIFFLPAFSLLASRRVSLSLKQFS